MTKRTKQIILLLTALLVAVLVFVNRQLSAKDNARAAALQLTAEIGGAEKTYGYREDHASFKAFDTEMRRKNGDVFAKNYSGIELSVILEELGVSVSDTTEVTAVCADNYEITLTGEEIMHEGNSFLVTQENGEKLDEESGPFMLVVNGDEFATRWGKNIVMIRINE